MANPLVAVSQSTAAKNLALFRIQLAQERALVGQTDGTKGLITGTFIAALFAGSWLWGLPVWITFHVFTTAASLYIGVRSHASILLAMSGIFALDVSTYLWGFPATPSIVLGVLAIIALMNKLVRVFDKAGDQNPLLVAMLVIMLRVFVAIVANDPPPSFGSSLLPSDWFGIFFLGTIPELPSWANVMLALATNGALILSLAIFINRLANPLAN